jgi:hypothetical protein
MSDIVPSVDPPEGKALHKSEITDLVAFCWRQRDAFYSACPTLAVDDAMCEVRISTP